MCTGRTRRGVAGDDDGDDGGRRGWGRGVLHVNLAGGLCLLALCGTARAGLLSDDVPFHITWPGHELTLPTSGALYRDEDYIIMTTQGNERYKCMLPTVERADQDDEEMGKAPDPDVLLDPLFKQNSCSYRIEPYWTYEVCHGRHVRQYHEEKEFGQRVTVQEYYLGYIAKHDPELKKSTETRSKHEYTSTKNNIPMKNIDGQMTAYYPVEMGDGTTCGLRGGVPRRASVLYVCHPNARHEVLSVAEVTSCEYEVVVLTPLLCRHPKYKFKTTPINDIYCKSFPGSPARPQSLDRMEQEQKESSLPRDTFQWTRQAVQEKSSSSDLAMKAAEQAHKPRATAQVGGQRTMTLISSVTDEQLLRAFLAGSHCFHGGVGWWKYELCYGRHVHQYHEEKDGTRTVIVVGTWNKEEHEVWAKGSTPRAYQRAADGTLKIKSVSHFYGHGDVCDINGKPRQVIVKLKCKESDSPHAVTVYMLEPHSCQYILGVESSLMCRILDSADDAGQLSLPP